MKRGGGGVPQAWPERFRSKVAVGPPGECWEWQAARGPKGYGRYNTGGSVKVASRMAWELTFGPIPAGLLVCHRCDNPPCVNPAHLFLGTHADNSLDMVAKGRSPRAPGERSGKAKLTEDQVRAIRAAYAAGEPTRSIAGRFGTTHRYVRHVATGYRRGFDGGAPVRRGRPPVDWTAWRPVYEGGATTIEIARATGRSTGRVSRGLRAVGTAMRPRGWFIPPDDGPQVSAESQAHGLSVSSSVLYADGRYIGREQ